MSSSSNSSSSGGSGSGKWKSSSSSRPAPTEKVRAEWLRRVEAEYRSAARTQHLTLWLIQIGASPDLVRAGLRIAGDEITHAEMSHKVFLAAGGEGGPALARESLELHRRSPKEPLEHDVARVAVEIFCLGETVAVPLFKELRAPCTVTVARQALDRVLKDEVRHRDFGWTMLGWLMEHPLADDLRALVTRELPHWFKQLRAAYVPSGATHATHDLDLDQGVSADERAWGLMPLSLYRSSVDKALTRDWIPRFARVGFDARVAWSGGGDR